MNRRRDEAAEGLLEPILLLHNAIRDAVVDACAAQSPEQLAAISDDSGAEGDTIYAIDRVGEDALVRGLGGLAHQSRCVWSPKGSRVGRSSCRAAQTSETAAGSSWSIPSTGHAA